MNNPELLVNGTPPPFNRSVTNPFSRIRSVTVKWHRRVGPFKRSRTVGPIRSSRHPYLHICMAAVVDCIAMFGIVLMAALITLLLGS